MQRRHLLANLGSATLAGALTHPATVFAQARIRRDSAVLGMTLEPPGLDPTAGASSAIAEVVLYNVFETLTKIRGDGSIAPLLAESWTVTPDNKTWAFKLRPGLRFHNGEPCNATAVKFSYERAAAEGSLNKDRAVFTNLFNLRATDDRTLVLTLKNPNPDLLFQLGQATAVIVEPKSVAGNATQPVGTGPYRLERWTKGSSITLARWAEHRDAKQVALARVTLRFIGDAAAQIAALLSGDVDAFPRVAAGRALEQFKSDRRYQVIVSGSRAKTILAINNRRRPLDDVRVRRAIASAIDRRAVIDGAADGYGMPIGSFYVPGAPGYVDLTAVNAYDPPRARALLKEAGITAPLELTMKLPPTPYARQGGEVIAAQLAKVGITAKLESVEWAQWLSGVYKDRAYDLTLISHVEPLDFGNFARPGYYWNYDSAKFNALWAQINATADTTRRHALLAQAQRLVADDVVAAYLYQPTWITIAKAGLKGLWRDMPILANELAALGWE
ncbi:ABC transporter substrate-binding protein [Sphaerotilus microaerophilus]|uniref:ABC transporter substrate-binding protein n=1 Tax=Sphaerotilus microaerophilus TaxID=2914710 RepID=A0ABM7YTF7_9BURK|nr:ABC transporter substrate-binding protein [Sphaerotilus sp. FB-5]BDI07944.1 ABC transporter substrate-binding protein [Sphaerotilus sp. FB-5]